MNAKSCLVLYSLLILLNTDYAFGQEKPLTPYFPYQKGDALVYRVFDFDRNYLSDLKLSVIKDSLGEDDKRYLASFLSDQEFSIDREVNIYSDDYYGVENSKIFDNEAKVNEPWILLKRITGSFELAIKREIFAADVFGIQDTLINIEYYLGEDSLSVSGLPRSEILWSSRFGLLSTFDSEGGNRNALKGAVLDGIVYGDTTVFTPPEEWEIQKDYFPYSDGDILVFTVKDSLGNDLSNSFIEFIQDSTDQEGSIWYSLNAKGSKPIANKFKVDTLKNVYATNWWNGNEELWKIYDSYNVQGTPWQVYDLGIEYELGVRRTTEIRSVFGRSFGIDKIYDVFVTEYYLAPDTITHSRDVPEQNLRVYTEWTKEFGVFHKYEYDTGLTYDLKGGVLNGFPFGDTTAIISSSEPLVEIPSLFTLHQNYPNPFNPSTNIGFSLEKASIVDLKIYSISGQLVGKPISQKFFSKGTHSITFSFDGLRTSFSSGIYFYELKTNFGAKINKMMLIK